MEADDPLPKLTSDLDYWEIRLNSGELVTLRAHAVGEEDGAYVFVALMEGSPPFEYELARFPKTAIQDFEGGWMEPRA
jgi:hypothetical protein